MNVISYIKSIFKPTTIVVNNIQDLFPYFDPDKFFIGVKYGCLDERNRVFFRNGMRFEFRGSPEDFVILPKSKLQEAHFE